MRFRHFRISFVHRNSLPSDIDGDCCKAKAQIRIAEDLRGERCLDVLIHEMLHADKWSASEKRVKNLATDMAKALWDHGYRKVRGPGD
jgi:hypothetical protein